MGSAIVRGMLDSGKFKADDIQVVLPSHSPHYEMVRSELKLKVWEEYPKDREFDVLLFGVKPQVLPEILSHYAEIIKSKKALILSIAAGKTMHFFQKFFPQNPIIRVMPNINVAVKHGATAGVANGFATDAQKEFVSKVFSTLGYFTWVNEEKLIDVVIGVSGSSPAYYFLFTEYLASIAEQRGLHRDQALKLAEAAFIGSAIMKEQTGQSLEELRAMVTSHKGTTFEAISEFEKNNALRHVMLNAFDAAVRRSKELSE